MNISILIGLYAFSGLKKVLIFLIRPPCSIYISEGCPTRHEINIFHRVCSTQKYSHLNPISTALLLITYIAGLNNTFTSTSQFGLSQRCVNIICMSPPPPRGVCGIKVDAFYNCLLGIESHTVNLSYGSLNLNASTF